jgi:hypothetical protein
MRVRAPCLNLVSAEAREAIAELDGREIYRTPRRDAPFVDASVTLLPCGI